MPQIKVERVVSFTSEDPTYPAQNILSTDTTKKWKCKNPGEKNASIVLQLDQPYLINSIDIGNENSAYIEVLVARSTNPDEFKVLLVMSTFMTPMEARQSQNINKVRMFKHADLSDPEREEKWDRIKIMCTQPFNRHVQYGLSFIKLHCPDMDKKIGKFALRAASPTTFTPGSLFAQVKEELKGAAAIRATVGSPVPKIKPQLVQHDPKTPQSSEKPQKRMRNELLYSKEEEDRHEKIDKIIEQRDKLKEKPTQDDKPKRPTSPSPHKAKKKPAPVPQKVKRSPSPVPHKAKRHRSPTPHKAKRSPSPLPHKAKRPRSPIPHKANRSSSPIPHKAKKPKLTKPFSRLLEKVVLVISGIQNPDRASLRTMALSMGAKYKPDWDATCTHLICAFANTPKFNQVKGKGKIVTRKWIEECYNERKRLPWRRFCLDKSDRGEESEEEVCTDDDTQEQGSDTEDRVKRVLAKGVYEVDTDVDDDVEANFDCTINQKMPDFFQDTIFYVDDALPDDIQQQARQYIRAYNGVIVENLEVSIEIIVTNEDNYRTFVDIYPKAHCVSPDWIWECHNRQKKVKMTDFLYT